MKRNRLIRLILSITALVLTVCMVSSCGIFNIIANYVITSMTATGPVDFNTVEYKRPDFKKIHDAFDDFLIDIKSGKTGLTLQMTLSEAYMLFNDAQTQYNVAEIMYYNNVNDTTAKEESEYCAEEFAKLQVKLTEVYSAIVEYNQSADLLPGWTDDDFARLKVQKKLFDDEYIEISAEIAKLQTDYMEASANITVTHQGNSYTIDGLVEMVQAGRMDYSLYSSLVSNYYQKLSEEVAPLYLKLVKLNNRIAEKAECESYQEYAYKYEYSRDYLPEDITKVYNYVKQYMPNYYKEAVESINSEVLGTLYEKSYSINEYKTIFNSYFATISSDMRDAFTFMQKYNLYSIGNKKGMQQAGFTTYLPSYEMPYIYLYFQGTIDDVSSFIHEFGHFYAFYKNNFESDSIIDVSEIHSQANELLFLSSYDITPEQRANYTLSKLADMFTTIIDGCLMDEFQAYVHKNIDSIENVNDLNNVFENIAKSYNYQIFDLIIPYKYIWAAIPHNFVAPFYYISYAMSALPSIEIFSIAQENRADAIKIYRNVLDETGYRPYLTVLEANNLSTPFEEKTYQNLESLLSMIKPMSYVITTVLPKPYSFLGLAA